MRAIVEIVNAGQLLVAFAVETYELALKIKSHFELDPAFTVNVKTLTGEAFAADQADLDRVNAWRQSIGLAPLKPSALPA